MDHHDAGMAAGLDPTRQQITSNIIMSEIYTIYLYRVFNYKWLQSVHCYYPWRYGSTNILGKKWTKRYILPLLNIPRTPVIHNHHSKYVLITIVDRNRFTQIVTRTNEECLNRGRTHITNIHRKSFTHHFKLKVQKLTWTKHWWFVYGKKKQNHHRINTTVSIIKILPGSGLV